VAHRGQTPLLQPLYAKLVAHSIEIAQLRLLLQLHLELLLNASMFFYYSLLAPQFHVLYEFESFVRIFESQLVSLLLHLNFAAKLSICLLQLFFQLPLLLEHLVLKLKSLLLNHFLGLTAGVRFLLVRVTNFSLLLSLLFLRLLEPHLLLLQIFN